MSEKFGATLQAVEEQQNMTHQQRVYAEMFGAIEKLGRKLEKSEEERERLARRLALIESAATLDEKTGKFYLPVAVDPAAALQAPAQAKMPKSAIIASFISCAIAFLALSMVLLQQSAPVLTPQQLAALNSLADARFATLDSNKDWQPVAIANGSNPDAAPAASAEAPVTTNPAPAPDAETQQAAQIAPGTPPMPTVPDEDKPIALTNNTATPAAPVGAAPVQPPSATAAQVLARGLEEKPAATAAPAAKIEQPTSQAPVVAETPATEKEDATETQGAAAPEKETPVTPPPKAASEKPVETKTAQARKSLGGDWIPADKSLPAEYAALEQRAFAGVPEAQHDLATLYASGKAVPQDYKRAVFWFSKAADGGIANAHYNLGVMFQQGLGVKKDVGKALAWYRSAAELGHPEAMYNLGIAYVQGIGTEKNVDKAAAYFRQAANAGVSQAAYNLGVLYESNFLGPIDLGKAKEWYRVAQKEGHADAGPAIERIEKQQASLGAHGLPETEPAAGSDGDGNQ